MDNIMKNLKRKNAESPFLDYYIYKNFNQKEGRMYAILVPKDKKSGNKRTFMTYARYLMSVKENRILEQWEQVDHIDEDKTNDTIDNLQILTRKENSKKEAKYQNKGRLYIRLKCPWCGTIFERRQGRTHLTNGATFTSCSRKCCTSFNSLRMTNPLCEKVQKGLRENFIEIVRYYNTE